MDTAWDRSWQSLRNLKVHCCHELWRKVAYNCQWQPLNWNNLPFRLLERIFVLGGAHEKIISRWTFFFFYIKNGCDLKQSSFLREIEINLSSIYAIQKELWYLGWHEAKMHSKDVKILLGVHPGQTPVAPGSKWQPLSSYGLLCPGLCAVGECRAATWQTFRSRGQAATDLPSGIKSLKSHWCSQSRGNETSCIDYLTSEEDEMRHLKSQGFSICPSFLHFSLKTSTSWWVWLYN